LKQIPILHIGRSITGIVGRRGAERAEIAKLERLEIEGRAWSECIRANPSKADGVIYFVLSNQSNLIGDEWSKRVVSDSISDPGGMLNCSNMMRYFSHYYSTIP
jgi:hypothetical protein